MKASRIGKRCSRRAADEGDALCCFVFRISYFAICLAEHSLQAGNPHVVSAWIAATALDAQVCVVIASMMNETEDRISQNARTRRRPQSPGRPLARAGHGGTHQRPRSLTLQPKVAVVLDSDRAPYRRVRPCAVVFIPSRISRGAVAAPDQQSDRACAHPQVRGDGQDPASGLPGTGASRACTAVFDGHLLRGAPMHIQAAYLSVEP